LQTVKGFLSFTGVPGHEFVGEVVSSPDKDLVGRRVVGDSSIVCGRCDLCQSGLSHHCRNRAVAGMLNHDGVFADFVRLPAINLYEVPADVDDDAAIFAEPLAAALQVVKQIKLDGRKWVTVLGDGRLGLLVAQVLRNINCPVRVIGNQPDKLAICEKWGIRSRPLVDIVGRHDQDVVIDCTGSNSGFEMAMQMVRPRGTIILKSLGVQATAVNLSPLVLDEISVIGSRGGSLREALGTLAEKNVDVVSLINRRMRLEQGVEAMRFAARPEVLKVILKMD
jgi:threonine dehydrogenase-like Zn-dependent dehydrogenase